MALVGMSARYPWQPRLPVSVGGVVSKTYADFQAHIATLATSGVRAWDASPAVGVWRTTAATATGTLRGTSWNTYYLVGSATVCRAVQHGLPSEVEFNAQVAGGLEMFFRSVGIAGQSEAISLTRNGYTSQSFSGVPNVAATCTELIYWDGTQAQQMNPSTGTGPTPYTW